MAVEWIKSLFSLVKFDMQACCMPSLLNLIGSPHPPTQSISRLKVCWCTDKREGLGVWLWQTYALNLSVKYLSLGLQKTRLQKSCTRTYCCIELRYNHVRLYVLRWLLIGFAPARHGGISQVFTPNQTSWAVYAKLCMLSLKILLPLYWATSDSVCLKISKLIWKPRTTYRQK